MDRARLAILPPSAALLTALLTTPAATAHGDRSDPVPGAPGVGDPYFPGDGNGGYDVDHYDLRLRYDPDTDVLRGWAHILAEATQDLESFNLDLQGMEVDSVVVNGRRAKWERDGTELTVRPARWLPEDRFFTVVVRYGGVPELAGDEILGAGGFIHTDDGALVAGQPHAAATWFPVNDHPIDKASYSFRVTVPAGVEAVANGVLTDTHTRRDWTTWRWHAKEPMASYLTVLAIGQFDLREYTEDGIQYWDAVDPDLYVQAGPRTGAQAAVSQSADLAYKRLGRTTTVPAEGATLSFWVQRQIEPGWDFMMVEAAPAGTDDWTTLPPLEGYATQDVGFACQNLLSIHPFLTHYLAPAGDGCEPNGTTGEWWAATGNSIGYEQWTLDLSRYAGEDVQVAISVVGDEVVAMPGAFVDDVVVSTGEGTTSFEDDGDTLDGWAVLGPPEGSPGNENDWVVAGIQAFPSPVGPVVDEALERQPEIVDFLSEIFGPYPFRAAGGIVDDHALGFALETQTRPVYDPGFFTDEFSGTSVIVHELAHQWVGDLVTLEEWQHIWLHEGFASYTEWLWAEQEEVATAQEIFDGVMLIPAEDPFWQLTIGDPGPEGIFDGAVYVRGAATLHALRMEVGDELFFEILRTWIEEHAGGHVSTADFVEHSEAFAGQELDQFFDNWLFTPGKPAGYEPEAGAMDLDTQQPRPLPLRELQDGLRRAG